MILPSYVNLPVAGMLSHSYTLELEGCNLHQSP